MISRQDLITDFFESIGIRTLAFFDTFLSMLYFLGEIISASIHFSRKKFNLAFNDFFLNIYRASISNLQLVIYVNFLIAIAIALIVGLQLLKYNAEIYIANAMIIGMTREITPIVVASILLFRVGSIYANDLAMLQIRHQSATNISWLQDNIDVVVLPKIFAMMFVMPLLYLWGNIIALAAGFVVATWEFHIQVVNYVDQLIDASSSLDLAIGFMKSILFGFLISFISCFYGFRHGGSTRTIGRAIIATITVGIAFIILSDTLLEILIINLQ